MDITWLGHAATRVRTRDGVVVMDPTDRSSGTDMARPTGDIVTVSRDHPHHNHADGVKGVSMVLNGPGEYEVRGVQVLALRASLLSPDAENGDEAAEAADAEAEFDADGESESVENAPDPLPAGERSTLFIIEAEDIRLAHLGGLGHAPTAKQAEALADVDVIVAPVAGANLLPPEEMAKVVRALEPKIVIPVCHGGEQTEEFRSFVGVFGVQPEAAVSRLTLNKRNVGDSLRILLLESRG